jgi:hypothetical protein
MAQDDEGDENIRMTMTISPDTEQWLNERYPDALELTEAVRMAVADARKFEKLGNKVTSAQYEEL